MKKFNFRMQKVLQFRKYKEEECKIAMGRAIGILSEIENNLKQTAIKRASAASSRFAEPLYMSHWNNYVIRLDQEADELAKKAAEAELIVEQKRALYLEASKDLKAIEKIREKREKEYRKEIFQLQTDELDSLTTERWCRRV